MNPTVSRGDEGAHEPGPEDLWNESWYFDFFAPDGSIGGWVRLGLYPNLGVAWYHAFLVRPGQAVIAVSDDTVALPRLPSLEIRATDLWADHVCETPLEHWTVTNETHGLAVEDPAVLYQDAPRGDLVPLALDLEWETDGEPYHYGATTRYEIPCRVHGDIHVGAEQVAFDGWGQRDHSWGVRDWWSFGWVWTSGRLDDGERFHGTDVRIPGVDVGFGYWQPAGHGGGIGNLEVTNEVTAQETTDADGFVTEGRVTIAGRQLALTPLAFAPALLRFGDRRARFPRALCRVESGEGGGLCWTEWNQPMS